MKIIHFVILIVLFVTSPFFVNAEFSYQKDNPFEDVFKNSVDNKGKLDSVDKKITKFLSDYVKTSLFHGGNFQLASVKVGVKEETEWPDPWIRKSSYKSTETEKLFCVKSVNAKPEDCDLKYTSQIREKKWQGNFTEKDRADDSFNTAQSEQKIVTVFTDRYGGETCTSIDSFKNKPFAHKVSDDCNQVDYLESNPKGLFKPAVVESDVTGRIGGDTVSGDIGNNIRKQYSITEDTVFTLVASAGNPSVTYSIPLQADVYKEKVLRVDDGFVGAPDNDLDLGKVPCEKISVAGKKLDALCKVRVDVKGKGSVDITPRVDVPYYRVSVTFDPVSEMTKSGGGNETVGLGKVSDVQTENTSTLSKIASSIINPVAKLFTNYGTLPEDESGSFSSASSQKVDKYPIRELVLDTLDKPVALMEVGDNLFQTARYFRDELPVWNNTDGTLTDTSTGQVWDIEYEKKGNSRSSCHPPVFNLKFDKKTKKGKKKPLFDGFSTYKDFGTLEYQKVRLISGECDVFNSGWSNNDAGLAGTLNVIFRESFLYSIARNVFKIPTVDVVSFANIKIKATDTDDSMSYPYMILQRDNEEDDQIPFTEQFGFLKDLAEASDLEGDDAKIEISISDSVTSIKYRVKDSGEDKEIKLDPDSTIRNKLFYQFSNMMDHFGFWNEDYGIDKNTGLGKIITYDFDLSLTCKILPVEYLADSILELIPKDKRDSYKPVLARVAKEIFGDNRNLDKMLVQIERFPFDVEKEKLREFVTIQFNYYALYFGSEKFAQDMGVPYEPFANEEEVLSQDELDKRKNDFHISCKRPPLGDFSKGHVFTVLPEFELSVEEVVKYKSSEWIKAKVPIQARFKIDVKAGSEPLKLNLGKNKMFQLMLVSRDVEEITDHEYEGYVFNNVSAVIDQGDSEMVFEKGIYTIPAGENVLLDIYGDINNLGYRDGRQTFPSGEYKAFISQISLGDDYYINPPAVFTDSVTVPSFPEDISEAPVLVSDTPFVVANIGENITLLGKNFPKKGGIIQISPIGKKNQVFRYSFSEADVLENKNGENALFIEIPEKDMDGNLFPRGDFVTPTYLRISSEKEGSWSNSLIYVFKNTPKQELSVKLLPLEDLDKYRPKEMVINQGPKILGGFKIETNDSVRLSNLKFKINITGEKSSLLGMHSFQLYKVEPVLMLADRQGKISKGLDGLGFDSPIVLEKGETIFAISVAPGEKLTPGQKIVLSADFEADGVSVSAVEGVNVVTNFPKGEIVLNTLDVVDYKVRIVNSFFVHSQNVVAGGSGQTLGGLYVDVLKNGEVSGFSKGESEGISHMQFGFYINGKKIPEYSSLIRNVFLVDLESGENLTEIRDHASVYPVFVKRASTYIVKADISKDVPDGSKILVTLDGADLHISRLVDSPIKMNEMTVKNSIKNGGEINELVNVEPIEISYDNSAGKSLVVQTPTISAKSAGKGRISAGEMSLKTSIKNNGEDVRKNFKNVLQYKASGGDWTDWVSFDVEGLGSGEKTDIEYKWVGADGVWEFRLIADIENVFKEEGERNNISGILSVTIVPPSDNILAMGYEVVKEIPEDGKPELSLSEPVVVGKPASYGQIHIGDMSISEKITNIGNGKSVNTKGIFQYSSNGRDWRDWVNIGILELNPGDGYTANYKWKGGKGVWDFRFCLLGEEETLELQCSNKTSVEVVE